MRSGPGVGGLLGSEPPPDLPPTLQPGGASLIQAADPKGKDGGARDGEHLP